MPPQNRHSYDIFESKQLPAIYKLSFYCIDDFDEPYDPLTFFVNYSRSLVSVEFQVAYFDKMMHYYFSENKWVAYDWETETQAMKAPNWKDYAIRAMNPEIHDTSETEGKVVAEVVLSRKNSFPHIFSNLEVIIGNQNAANVAFSVLEASVLELLKI